jgi:fatty acid synthase subunit alpha
MTFITSKLSAPSSSSTDTSSTYSVLLASLSHFTANFLTASNSDVHSLVQSYDPDSRKEILSAYFKALSLLESKYGKAAVPKQPKSGLFAAAEKGEAEIYALFGGQGTNEVSLAFLLPLLSAIRPCRSTC